MKVVILCGGLGTRLREETEFRPKPMVPVGGRPVLWHIMKTYASHGHKEFILCLGYKGEVIKEYFRNYHWNTSDVTLTLGSVPKIKYHSRHDEEDWTVTLVDTGQDTLTGGRLQRVLPYVGEEDFLLSYGDGLSDNNITASIDFHKKHGALATVTAVMPESRFGELTIENDTVTNFREKPTEEVSLINGGYFVLSPRIAKYLTGDKCIFEQEPMRWLAEEKQLKAWVHRGFWQCMDTFREQQMLEALWQWACPVENLVMFAGAYQGKVVWLSGHTGFKGAWLAGWLLKLGAQVHGFSLPPAYPSLFEQTGLEGKIGHEIGDVRDAGAVQHSIDCVQPDFVFHLAAQALVRYSYDHPLETYSTNVMGTVNVLEALRTLDKPCAAVFVTTDKCYENRESEIVEYSEEDHLGGHDPYSSSKAAAEIVISAYRRSFFGKLPVRIASARAGNVIGGGDWALDRIIPDCICALRRGEAIPVRNPAATRPWQHVLEPLGGYLWLGAALVHPELVDAQLEEVAAAFNFGPEKESNRPVADVVQELLKSWPGTWEDKSDPHAVHEARLLMLSTAKAKRVLHWSPVLSLEGAVGKTACWYRKVTETPALAEYTTLAQIEEYEQAARNRKILWATHE